MDSFSPRRLAENEVIYREVNQNIQQFLDEVDHRNHAVSFYCECSREDCRKRIKLTTKEYGKLHQNNRQFIVIDRHEVAEVEKIIKHCDGFNVVEKFISTPSPEEINSALKKIDVKGE